MRLTAENTAVVLDSASDFPNAQQRYPNFRVVPLYVRFGDESYKDYVEMGPDEFYARLETSPVTPTTSQPTPADFLSVYEELAPSYARIISLQLSSTISGTFESARTAAELLGGTQVRVIDSRTVAAAIAILAIGIQERLELGTTDEEIDAYVARYQRDHHLLFTVSTLEYLQRGGRIGRARALAGNLLNVKPILTFRDGEVLPLKKVRGNAKAFAEFRDLFEASSVDDETLKVGIAHAAAPDRLAALRDLVEHDRPRAEIVVATQLGAVIGTHAGPGTVGFFWFKDG
jgi:DegV family protein with EDD domain